MSQLFVETLSKTTEIEIYKDNIIIKRLDLDLSINLNTLRTMMKDEMGLFDWFFTKENNEITRELLTQKFSLLTCASIAD